MQEKLMETMLEYMIQREKELGFGNHEQYVPSVNSCAAHHVCDGDFVQRFFLQQIGQRYVVTSFSTITQFMEKRQKRMANTYSRKNRYRFSTINAASLDRAPVFCLRHIFLLNDFPEKCVKYEICVTFR